MRPRKIPRRGALQRPAVGSADALALRAVTIVGDGAGIRAVGENESNERRIRGGRNFQHHISSAEGPFQSRV